MHWTAENIKSAIGGTFIARATSPLPVPPTDSFFIDSRAVTSGSIFFAIKGDRTDGHAYLADVIAKGAATIILHDAAAYTAALTKLALPSSTSPPLINVIQVDDTRQALLRLASAHRKTLETTKVIAIGGSNGKTTTCKLLQSLLSTSLRGSASQKSFNNDIGVPLTILGAKRTDQYLICEIGTNAPGEIAPLAAIISPDIAVITSIGREHLEGLGDLKGVIAEEANLIPPLRAGGAAIITADTPALTDIIRPLLANTRPDNSKSDKPRTLFTFGHADTADLRLTDIQCDPQGTTFTLNNRDSFRIPLLGKHNACNAAAAIAVARRLGLSQSQIEQGLLQAAPADMRMQQTTINDITFINDAYNANPDSTLAAIRTFADVFASSVTPPTGRRVLIFGDMLELGTNAPTLHSEIGEAIAKANCFDLILLVGPLTLHAAKHITSVPFEHFPDASPPNAQIIAHRLKPGDRIMLKASRGTGLERIMTALTTPPIPPIPPTLPSPPPPTNQTTPTSASTLAAQSPATPTSVSATATSSTSAPSPSSNQDSLFNAPSMLIEPALQPRLSTKPNP